MKIAAMENPRNRQEELGLFLTPTPVTDFMAWNFVSLWFLAKSKNTDAGLKGPGYAL